MPDNKAYPFVSIIIPARNEEKYIDQCLRGLLKLDYPEDKYEIIVVNNNSADQTRNIVKKYQGVMLLEKKDGTIGAVRNFGEKEAGGEFIAFLDGDCVPDKRWLKVGCNKLMENEDVSCIGFAIAEPTFEDPWVERTWYKMGSGSKYCGTCDVAWLSSFNLIVKKDIFLRAGGFDESLETCEDADLGYKLSKISRLIFSDEISIRHLGNAKTVKGFFLKELWRGKGNLKSYLQNKNKIKNSPSVLIPVVYLAAILFLILLLFQWLGGIHNKPAIYFTSSIIVFSPILLALRKQKRLNGYDVFRVAFLFFVYLSARGLAVFKLK